MCSSIPIKPCTLILTMYLLWSKGENKLHFSIFWKPVICTQEIRNGTWLQQNDERINCTSSIIAAANGRKHLQTIGGGWDVCTETVIVDILRTSSQTSYLWTSHQAHLSRTQSPGREQRRCGTAPGISRLGTGYGSACGSTWAGGWEPSEEVQTTLYSSSIAPSGANRTQQASLIGLDSRFLFSSTSTQTIK